MTEEPKKYYCVFCHLSSNQVHFGCPQCGQLGYGKARVVITIVVAQGVLFTLIGGFLFFVGLKVLISELRLPYEMAPWWLFVIIFSSGALFTVGGISSFFGNAWLLRLLLFLFARNLGTSTSATK